MVGVPSIEGSALPSCSKVLSKPQGLTSSNIRSQCPKGIFSILFPVGNVILPILCRLNCFFVKVSMWRERPWNELDLLSLYFVPVVLLSGRSNRLKEDPKHFQDWWNCPQIPPCFWNEDHFGKVSLMYRYSQKLLLGPPFESCRMDVCMCLGTSPTQSLATSSTTIRISTMRNDHVNSDCFSFWKGSLAAEISSDMSFGAPSANRLIPATFTACDGTMEHNKMPSRRRRTTISRHSHKVQVFFSLSHFHLSWQDFPLKARKKENYEHRRGEREEEEEGKKPSCMELWMFYCISHAHLGRILAT